MNRWTRYSPPLAIVLLCPTGAYATQYLSVEEAQKLSFPKATSFEQENVVFTPEQIAKIEERSGQKVTARGQQIWRAMDGKTILGYFVVDYVIGKHLIIDYAVALNPDATVARVEVMQYRESYGGEIRNDDWLKQFIGKNYQSPLKLNDDVINIGGATLSSRHVTEGVKRVLATFSVVHS